MSGEGPLYAAELFLRGELVVRAGFLPSPDNPVSLGALARRHHRWIRLAAVRGIHRQRAIERQPEDLVEAEDDRT